MTLNVAGDGIHASRRLKTSGGNAPSSLLTDSCKFEIVGGNAITGETPNEGRGLVIGTPLWNGVKF